MSVSAHLHGEHVVDDPRAWDMTLFVLVGVADVDDADLRVGKMALKPVAGNNGWGSGRRREREDFEHRGLDVVRARRVREREGHVRRFVPLPVLPYLMNSISR